MPFQSDFVRLNSYFVGLKVLSTVDCALMNLHVNVLKLQKEMEASSTGRGSGLDGTS